MLSLTRREGEVIMIGDDVEISVVRIRGDKVMLGITAPSEVQVHRKEVYERIKRENRAASNKPGELRDKGKRSYRMIIQDERNYLVGPYVP